MEKKISLPKLHECQQMIITNSKRINIVKTGRRFGKTELIKELSLIALDGKKVGIWFPTYKDLDKVWNNLKEMYISVRTNKDEQLKTITLMGGGMIDFWSMDNPDSGRGVGYHRAIIDEAAKTNNLKKAFELTIRPTLSDYVGDMFVFSTPKGKYHYFHELCERAKIEGWGYFHFTTYDNPFIRKSEIEEAKKILSDMAFRQEYLAEDVDANDRPYLYSFSEKHITEGIVINPHLPLWISFDFNKDPMSCILGQQTEVKSIRIIAEICLSSSSTEELCECILGKYSIYNKNFIVTGDASGNSRSSMVRGNVTNWMLIKRMLKLNDSQIRVRGSNIGHQESRVLCNSVIENADVLINKDCKNLIKDIEMANVDEMGNLIKSQLEGRHFFDCFRYIIDGMMPDFISNYKKYIK